MEEKKTITSIIREMKVGEVLEFPLDKQASIMRVFVPRLRMELWREKADWKREGDYDLDRGVFALRRTTREP